MIVHISILLFLLFINLLPPNYIDRKKYILPFSFIIITVYWAIRYDYGLDYWNYYTLFYDEAEDYITGFGERLFFSFTHIFKHYYQVIIAESIILGITFFHIVKKYVSEEYYWLFFFSLFAVYSFHFNIISAQRSSMAACILYWAYEWFFVERKKWLLFFVAVFLAANFHTSALLFAIVPLFYFVFNSIKGRSILLILFVCNLLSMFYVDQLFVWLISSNNLSEAYMTYSKVMGDSNFTGFLFKILFLIPTYYICLVYDQLKDNKVYRAIFILAFTFLFIYLIGLDFQGRFTVYLFPFFIIALCKTCQYVLIRGKWIALTPFILMNVYTLYKFYNSMFLQITSLSNGNPYYYSTIFDAASLP